MTVENGAAGSVGVLNMSVAGVDPKSAPHGVAGAPNEAALLALMERTGFTMIQENGQRKYGGPPPNWEGPPPPRGCEIFVGKIPRDCYEDELVPIFEKLGSIYELRLMMDFSGANRGYCFVQFTDRSAAKRAMKDLNNYEIRKGRFLGVCLSVDNCRLFVGGIPKNKQREEILAEMSKVTEGVMDVIVYPSATDKAKNRGFAFVEYESHRAAAMARRKLIPGRIQLWGHQIAVDWAEPEQEVDEDVMSKVRILYVRNLMLTTTEETIEQSFNAAVNKENAVERVKKLRDYAFVHFREREDALAALESMNNTNLDGSFIEVVLAKPVDKNEYVRYTRSAAGVPGTPGRGPMPQAYAAAYGLAAESPFASNPYYPHHLGGSPVAGAGLSLRDLQNRTHLGASMVGMRPAAFRGRGRGAAGSRGAGGIGRGSYVPSYLRSPYRKYPTDVGGLDERLYDLLPGMELTPTNPVTLKPQSVKQPVQVLEEFCQKNGWGSPTYQLHSTLTRDAGSGSDIQLFLFKVSIPTLANHYPSSTFQPNKLCRSVEEAKNYAAEYVLLQLGVPMEGGDATTASPGAICTSPAAATSPITYQARALAPPTAYSLTNGGPCITHSDLTYATSVPIVSSSASYMVAPAKVPTPVTHQSSLQSFQHAAAFGPMAAAAFQQY